MAVQAELGGGFCILAAFLCLSVPLPWLTAALFAAAIHEACHILAVRVSGGTILRFRIGWSGAVLEAAGLTRIRELFSVLAGPLGSLLLLTIYPIFPRTALCGAIQGLFNLLPVYPLDGGRALWCIAEGLFSQNAVNRLCFFAETLTCAFVLGTGIWLTFCCQLGWMPVLVALLLISRAKAGKFSCKAAKLGVQ